MTKRTPAQYDWNKALFNDRRLSKHFTSPRRSKIKTVTLHHMTIVAAGDGSGTTSALEGCYSTWQTRQASANYGVSGDQVWQYVSDNDAAWANASSSNHETLSIEHANSTAGPSWKVSDKTMATGARLVATLHRLYGLGRPSRKTVKMHRDYYATACPGPYMVDHLADYIAEAARIYDGAGTVTPPKPSKPAPAKKAKWFSALGWNLAVSNDHGRATWNARFPKIVDACTDHYSRDVLMFTEAWAVGNDSKARKLLKAAGFAVAGYYKGRAVVVRDSIKTGRVEPVTFKTTGPANDTRHGIVCEAFPDGSGAVLAVAHYEHRDGAAYDAVRVKQAKEFKAFVEATCKAWGYPLDRVLVYADENSASMVSDQAWGSSWPDVAVSGIYPNTSLSTLSSWSGVTVSNDYRPDKFRTSKDRPTGKSSTSATFAGLSDHLPILTVLNRQK